MYVEKKSDEIGNIGYSMLQSTEQIYVCISSNRDIACMLW